MCPAKNVGGPEIQKLKYICNKKNQAFIITCMLKRLYPYTHTISSILNGFMTQNKENKRRLFFLNHTENHKYTNRAIFFQSTMYIEKEIIQNVFCSVMKMSVSNSMTFQLFRLPSSENMT